MTDESFLSGIDRRTFLKIVSITGVAGLVYPQRLLSGIAPLDLSRVVVIEDTAVTSGLSIDAGIVQSMMDCGIMALTGQYDVGEAWKSLLPGITETDVVAIKVNCASAQLPSHPEVAFAIRDGLYQIDFDGTPFNTNNVIIYDRTNTELTAAGYTIRRVSEGYRCFGTSASGIGYSAETWDVNGTTQSMSTILTERSDYLVNLSCLKNHGIAGATLCLKNHFGTCSAPDQLHPNDCDPYAPALNASPPIHDKQCVNIVDALFGIVSGGPTGSPQIAANSLIIGQDIVAVDYLGREMLADNGCLTTAQAHHVDAAAGAPYNLGTNDPAQMDVVNISNPADVRGGASPGTVALAQNSPNPFSGSTEVRFYLPKSAPVELGVYDSSGRRVRRLASKTLDAGWHGVHWNGTNEAGRRVASGVYFCQLRTEGYRKAVLMQLVR
jgi:hypothetical protein